MQSSELLAEIDLGDGLIERCCRLEGTNDIFLEYEMDFNGEKRKKLIVIPSEIYPESPTLDHLREVVARMSLKRYEFNGME